MSRPPLEDENSETGLIGLGPIPGQSPVAAFNLAGIENLLKTKSFLAFHYRHAPNPDRASLYGPVNVNEQAAHRGVRYYAARPLGIVPQQFKIEDRLTAQGLWGLGSVLMNVTGQYFDNGPEKNVYVRPRDLLVFPSLTMQVDQLFEYNPAGLQRLNYKVKGVDYLSDDKFIYSQGVDFDIESGQIKWLDGGRKPAFINGQGAVLTCVYYTTPIYVVMNLPHSLRVIPSNAAGHGAMPREAVYAPQLLVCKPSTIVQENDIMSFWDLPPFPDYPDTLNVTGGSI